MAYFSEKLKAKSEKPKLKTKNFKLYVLVLSFSLCTLRFPAFADTIYLNSGVMQKGLVVEEYYDRFVFSTADGEKEIPKSDIDEIFFDEPYQNNLYMGKKFGDEGNFENALKFYKLALQSNPDFKTAQDAIKGLEDAKWRFKKSWRYRELKETLKAQLGISLKKVNEKILIGANAAVPDTLEAGDAIISCWAEPLTYAGLKNTSRILIGASNTILKLVIERDIKLKVRPGFKIFLPVAIGMELKGPVIGAVAEGSAFYNSGLRKGDLIVKINGESTRYMTLTKVRKKIFRAAKNKIITVRKEITLMRKRPEDNNTKNAMWAWHSKEILLSEGKKKELLDFCKDKNIKALFFQLQYQFLPFKGQTVCKLLYEARLRAFLKEAHAQGVIVYALDGFPGFCLKDQHYLVFSQINAILDFNKIAQPQERFDGVHYDNEPYLLPGFNSVMRETIINQFLALNQECRQLINTSGLKLEFGVDIPFWFDELDSLDKKLIDICDDIGIMDYRNFASTPDGIIAHALDKLKYAAQVKKRVFVGIETSRYPDQEVYFVSVLNKDEFNKYFLKKETPDFARGEPFEGFSLRIYCYDNKIYIGLVRPAGAKEENFKKALLKLETIFERIAQPEKNEDAGKLIFDVIYALSQNPEFRDVKSQGYNSENNKPFLMFVAKEVILEKLTFADLSEKAINDTMAEAKKEFENYPSFAGFAIHHYKSYRELCEKKN